ncbi:hypothetical protein LIA77_03476 [Sarocladium implicatum]|nr:hypothetical protein LIA77_03476 [Sarocladium implicatum]
MHAITQPGFDYVPDSDQSQAQDSCKALSLLFIRWQIDRDGLPRLSPRFTICVQAPLAAFRPRFTPQANHDIAEEGASLALALDHDPRPVPDLSSWFRGMTPLPFPSHPSVDEGAQRLIPPPIHTRRWNADGWRVLLPNSTQDLRAVRATTTYVEHSPFIVNRWCPTRRIPIIFLAVRFSAVTIAITGKSFLVNHLCM